MTITKQKIGFQHVGSFLRPTDLKQARVDFEAGKIDQAALTAVEDKDIRELVSKEKAAGLDYVTDGEFRRAYWHLDFFWGFNGIEHNHLGGGYNFHKTESRDDSAIVSGKISFNPNHPFLKHFAFLKSLTDEIGGVLPKQTIPAPGQLYAELVRGENEAKTKEFYPNEADLIADIQKAYHDAIIALYNEGARTIQLDDCSWGFFLDKDYVARSTDQNKYDSLDTPQVLLDLNNGAIEDLPDDLTINTHVCRGNFRSDYIFSGGYDTVADYLFAQENVDTYFLEYDSDRAGGFEPLAKVSGDKRVVLGLVTTKSPELEDRQVIIDRIKEASQYLPLDRLWLSTQCGFASTEEGNELTDEQQWAKLKLVKSIIDEIW
ncbi:5-methyltetrahydropteroyltriglutamate--homocysteine S-methyltransferase [Companilactobacillus mishanensis]|uniref:5-methyltetrahydropteroyltriglutamate--homocysteine S-methyltransferase n=1 Tax=Companilactobacillus mishanensis TaxID=2486008 RepID=A0ABW9P8M7_9LACO|nr:5-methyltetrahydropteroyltriglutamate--homocysteine S-methyltransferase [Companilactobacillus mishanensis]MQS45569.1 5-methyltetrahydropteroyltriglutamate--homocysteine S-methyltransferase [Companilactobacillus mishanensis]